MIRFSSSQELRAALRGPRAEGKTIALVPTMGNLHAGHLSLVGLARQRADRVVVSIFVNPLQFDQVNDLANYPRTEQQDLALLTRHGVDWAFLPSAADLYPDGLEAAPLITVRGVSEMLEGENRPGHFEGVATVVAKLFNIVQPDLAVFGEKDFQQLLVVRKMVRDLDFPVRIVAAPTVREADGLAMSSRNSRLTEKQRRLAPQLHRLLSRIADFLREGAKSFASMEKKAEALLRTRGFEPDYIAIRNARTLAPAEESDDELVVLAAVRLGEVRLIDNIPVSLKKPG